MMVRITRRDDVPGEYGAIDIAMRITRKNSMNV
jgi:hypothetical protein